MTATISPFLRDNVIEMAAFLRTSENSFVNQCIQSCLEAIYAPHDFKPSQFVMDVRRLSSQSTPITPLLRELMKELFSGLSDHQMAYLKNLIETTVGSGVSLDPELLKGLKKIAMSLDLSSCNVADGESSESAWKDSWDDIWNHPFPPHRAKGADLKQRKPRK